MKIGELAKLAGCLPVTARFYEKKGLLPSPPRSAANYREYDEKDAERLRFIRHCREHGMSLEEISTLIDLAAAPADSCRRTHALLRAHIENIERRLEDLKILKASLERLLDSCRGGSDGCAALKNLRAREECEYCALRDKERSG